MNKLACPVTREDIKKIQIFLVYKGLKFLYQV